VVPFLNTSDLASATAAQLTAIGALPDHQYVGEMVSRTIHAHTPSHTLTPHIHTHTHDINMNMNMNMDMNMNMLPAPAHPHTPDARTPQSPCSSCLLPPLFSHCGPCVRPIVWQVRRRITATTKCFLSARSHLQMPAADTLSPSCRMLLILSENREVFFATVGGTVSGTREHLGM